jgi:small subunit ribosomal protein S27e
MEFDLLNIPFEKELTTHKLRRTIPAPNSYFQNIKCIACESTQISFSHGQSKVVCLKCSQVLALPTGGKLKMTAKGQFQVLSVLKKKIIKEESKVQRKTDKAEEKPKTQPAKKN